MTPYEDKWNANTTRQRKIGRVGKFIRIRVIVITPFFSDHHFFIRISLVSLQERRALVVFLFLFITTSLV